MMKKGLRILAYALLIGIAIAILTPLVWTIVSSFRPVGDIFANELPRSFEDFTFENYRGLYEPIVREVGVEQRLGASRKPWGTWKLWVKPVMPGLWKTCSNFPIRFRSYHTIIMS